MTAAAADAPVATHIVHNELQAVEPAVLVRSSNIPDQTLLDRAGSTESFASLPKTPARVPPPQLKSGFVGSWASDARACEARPGTGSDVRTIIGERGARAGANSCAFKQTKQIANA